MIISRNTTQAPLLLAMTLLFAACQPQADDSVTKDIAGGESNHVSNDSVENKRVEKRPNILFIIVDDMGMADIGSFGGEIETPNLDKLAYNSTRLSNFSVAPACSPTRAMLLTGVDSHLNGLGNMLEETSPNQKGQPGYEGVLNERVVTVTELLRDSGYRTFLSGKWHLGGDENARPSARGFQRSFSLISGGASHFPDMRPAYAPTPDVKAPYFEDGEKLTKLPDNFEYSSQFYVDQLIEYIGDSKQDDKPFFGVLAFTAPHWPLQAPDAAIAKYKGRYDAGYDALLAQRFKRQQQLGVIPASAKLNAMTRSDAESGKAWADLSVDEKRESARAMEVYAAMIDQVDVHIGRLVAHLEKTNQLEDTLIVFLSDNGAEAHDLDETWPKELFPNIRKTIDEAHDFSFANMGRPNSYVLYGRGWGKAGSPAYRLHKAFPTEGGMRVAAFVHFPTKVPAGEIDNRQYFVTDLAPTVLELAGVEVVESYRGKSVLPISGVSLLRQWQNPSLDMPNRVRVFELFGKRMVKRYPWKLVHMPTAYGNDAWQLFNLQEDLTESVDRAEEFPEIVKNLKAHWEEYAGQNGVILPDWVSGY